MIIHPRINLLCVAPESTSVMAPFLSYLKEMPHVLLTVLNELPTELSKFQTVITAPASTFHPAPPHLEQFVRSGGGWLGIVSLSESPISDLFGVSPGPVGPASEIRVLFQNRNQ